MSDSDAFIGYDTEYAIGDGYGNFVDLAEVFEVTPPEIDVGEEDVTHYKSPNRAREYIPTLADNGNAMVSMNYLPGSPTDLRILELRASSEVLAHRITFPNGVTMTFDGFVKNYAPDPMPVDGKVTARLTVRISGPITQVTPGT